MCTLPAMVFTSKALYLGMVPPSDQDRDSDMGLRSSSPSLSAKKGLAVLTSRNESAPPIPRDLVGTPPPSRPGMSPKIGNRNNNESAAPPVEVLDEKIDGPSHDLPNPVNLILISGLEPQPLGNQS